MKLQTNAQGYVIVNIKTGMSMYTAKDNRVLMFTTSKDALEYINNTTNPKDYDIQLSWVVTYNDVVQSNCIIKGGQ